MQKEYFFTSLYFISIFFFVSLGKVYVKWQGIEYLTIYLVSKVFRHFLVARLLSPIRRGTYTECYSSSILDPWIILLTKLREHSNKILVSDLGSHFDYHKYDHLLGPDGVWSARSSLTFQRNVMPPSSESKDKTKKQSAKSLLASSFVQVNFGLWHSVIWQGIVFRRNLIYHEDGNSRILRNVDI